jgi:signal transduction histidine kinase
MSEQELTKQPSPAVPSAPTPRGSSARDVRDPGAERSPSMTEMSDFVETALHDLRAPLRNIRQAMEWLGEHLGDTDGTTSEYLGLMREATDRIDSLAGALGTLGRVECHVVDPDRWTIDDLADEAAGRVRAIYPAPWTLVVEEPRALVSGDRSLIVALLEVLFGNAVEYRHPGRRLIVTVRVDGHDDGAFVEVSDNGIGMEERYQALVVEPFRRLHTRHEHPGSGLGLTIANQIVGRHAGRLDVSSTLGEGTTVRCTLSEAASRVGLPAAAEPEEIR